MPSPAIKNLVRESARPIGTFLASGGITADAVTVAGLCFAALCGVLLALGEWTLAFVSLLVSGLCDMLDGAVARARGGGGTAFGAALDSTADRYGEALILGGILVDAVHREVGAGFLVVWTLSLIASFLTSYVRARAEGLGLSCEVGILERPERLVLLAILCLLGPSAAPYVLGVLALGGHVTFIQRLHRIARIGGSGGSES
jgi:CDP-diacylglycerol--glycerol-3-phosphate 3-phosphatidyltransferase